MLAHSKRAPPAALAQAQNDHDQPQGFSLLTKDDRGQVSGLDAGFGCDPVPEEQLQSV